MSEPSTPTAVPAEPTTATGNACSVAPPAATSRRALLLWTAFTVGLATAGCLLVSSSAARLWYYDLRFRRADTDARRTHWARRMAGLPIASATRTLRDHALGDDDDRAISAALALSTGVCPDAQTAFDEVRREWSADRHAAFGWYLLRASGQDKTLLPMLPAPGAGPPGGATPIVPPPPAGGTHP